MRKREQAVELVKIAIPLLAELVVVLGFIAMIALWIIIGSTAGPA